MKTLEHPIGRGRRIVGRCGQDVHRARIVSLLTRDRRRWVLHERVNRTLNRPSAHPAKPSDPVEPWEGAAVPVHVLSQDEQRSNGWVADFRVRNRPGDDANRGISPARG